MITAGNIGNFMMLMVSWWWWLKIYCPLSFYYNVLYSFVKLVNTNLNAYFSQNWNTMSKAFSMFRRVTTKMDHCWLFTANIIIIIIIFIIIINIIIIIIFIWQYIFDWATLEASLNWSSKQLCISWKKDMKFMLVCWAFSQGLNPHYNNMINWIVNLFLNRYHLTYRLL